MLYRTEGIVLKSIPYGEADLIVTLLTLDYGLIKVFAKSPRKTGSRFGSSLEPFTYSRISFWSKENKELSRLTQADIIKNFQALRDDLEYFLRILKIIELPLKFLPERETHREVFYLLLDTLNKIEGLLSSPPTHSNLLSTVILFYTIHLLDMAGYGPRLNGCGRCNRSGLNFYLSQGSVLCEDCAATSDHIRLTPRVVRVYETLRRWNIAKLERIRLTEPIIKELSSIIDAHIRYTVI